MMNSLFRNSILLATLTFFACAGLLLSWLAPYAAVSDEIVYLTGTLQAKQGDLPDPALLQGLQFGPYLYPKVLSLVYEPLGYFVFKSLYLVFLVLAVGLSAYAMFRILGLAWVPALMMSLVLLMPRFSSGLEIFGVLTFKEAIGRASALPLFLLGTALLIQRIINKKALWPLFFAFGLGVFLHPVSVTLFAFASLLATCMTEAFLGRKILKAIANAFVSGLAFILGGAYFFFEVFQRLSLGAVSQGVNVADYVSAVVLRNTWEFPSASIAWFPHMGIVSGIFLLAIALFYMLPKFKVLRLAYPFQNGEILVAWGLSLSFLALALTLLVPGVNLYLMQHADVPYIFQQWSRISKFYYLGIFVALVPVVVTLWQWYRSSKSNYRHVLLTLVFIVGLGSSSFGFEVAQFAIGYKNFSKEYVPQALSGIPDDMTAEEYRELCAILARLGQTKETTILSTDFALRYYCKANLHVTFEEGSAYTYLSRAEMIDWKERYLMQRQVLASQDWGRMYSFAKDIDATFVVLSRTKNYQHLELLPEVVATTSRRIILRVDDLSF